MKKTKLKPSFLAVTVGVLLSGCASTLIDPNAGTEAKQVDIQDSYLKSSNKDVTLENAILVNEEKGASEFVRLNSASASKGLKLEIDLAKQFDNKAQYELSVNELPLNDFLHYVFGELLQVSYLIEPKVKSNETPVTMELKEAISGQRLFSLAQQVLNQNGMTIALNDGVYYVHTASQEGGKSNIAFGYGKSIDDVPFVSGDIMQLVPLSYGTSPGLRQTVSALVDATISLDSVQGLVVIKGKRTQVVRALSLISLLDSAAFKTKSMALLSFQYIDAQTYIEEISQLLENEGIASKRGVANSTSVKFVPLEHLGKVVVFASSDTILDRVQFWTEQLDKPSTGAEQSFYTYHPKYARAADLGASLAPLISDSGNSNARTNAGNSATAASPQRNNQRATNNSASQVQTVVGDELKLVVDERSNSLIFYSSGRKFQELQPIIKKLDVMPKQVMLEVVIAEVKLTGSFAKGVEFALSNGPSGSRKETFSFNSEDGFNYSVVGLDGNINLNLNEKDDLVNVLSRPTILVRDGVSASISVGDDIPTVGSTTTDPLNSERQTTTIQYRKTGVELSVTPTVNAQGTVIMTIEQNISSVSPDGTSISGSPAVFERKISTEVVAGDGQSVMLGGLISENKTTNAKSVPVLGDIPVLGHLFRSDSESSDKTELVVLVTPKIIHNANEWKRIQDSFLSQLENLEFNLGQ